MTFVLSKDGTTIAYTKSGSGPAVVLVDGAGSYRKFGTAFFIPPLLSKHFTVYAYDRRGRGESSNTTPYAIEREIEDLHAIMEEAGGSPYVYSHSSGAALTMYGVASGLRPAKLVLYEPPFVVVNRDDVAPPADAMQQLQARIGAGKPAEAMTYWLTQILRVPGFVVVMIKVFMSKHWKHMVAAAHTLPYDLEIVERSAWSVPKAVSAKIDVPCVVMGGAKSPAKLRNAVKAVGAAIPGAEIMFLEGIGHNVTAKALVPTLKSYFR